MKVKLMASGTIQSAMKETPFSISSLQSSVICLLYYFLLSLSYKLEVGPKWGVTGFGNEFSFIYALTSIVSIFTFFNLLGIKSNFRSLILVFAFLTIYVPAMVYLSFGNPSLWLGFVYFMSLLPLVHFSKVHFGTLRVRTLPKPAFVIFLLVFIGFSLFLLASRAGFGNINFDIYAVYDFRRDIAVDIGVQLNKTLSFVSKVVLPLFFIYIISMKTKFRIFLILMGAVYTALIFGYWQHKSALFLPIGVLGLYTYLRHGFAERRLLLLFLFLSVVLSAEAILYSMQNLTYPGTLNALIGRRALFVPPLLADYYLDFFSSNEKIYWSGLTRHFGASLPAYNLAPAFLIGANFFGNEEMSANVGFIGSGYANAGLLGVLIYSSFLGLAIAYVSAQAKRLGDVFIFCLTAFVFHTGFASSDLITSLLSHGLLLTLVAIPFLKRLQ